MIWLSWPNAWAELWERISMVHLTICSDHFWYPFQSESTLYICLNVNGLPARDRHNIWSLSDCNWTRMHSHLVCKQTLNHLAKLTKSLSWVVTTYIYGAFDCMFLSSHIPFSESMHTLYMPEYQGTSCTKQAQYLKFKCLQLESNPQALSS